MIAAYAPSGQPQLGSAMRFASPPAGLDDLFSVKCGVALRHKRRDQDVLPAHAHDQQTTRCLSASCDANLPFFALGELLCVCVCARARARACVSGRFGAIVDRLNGTITDSYFGSHKKDRRGSCQKGCIRDFVDLAQGVRVSFLFLTYIKLHATLAGLGFLSESMRPDVVLLACGAWDLHINTASKRPGGHDNPWKRNEDTVVSESVFDLYNWVKFARQTFWTDTVIVIPNVIACNRMEEFRRKSIAFNTRLKLRMESWLDEFGGKKGLVSVDREPSTVNSTQTKGTARALSRPWRLFCFVVTSARNWCAALAIATEYMRLRLSSRPTTFLVRG